MTLDDLEILFRDKIAAGHEIRAGIRAVVLALRDEFDSIMWGNDEWNNEGIVGHFNDILGDAGEKAAGGRERDDALQTTCPPVADPSPQCEWTAEEYTTYSTSCESEQEINPHRDDPTFCPSCGLPIKFKEPT